MTIKSIFLLAVAALSFQSQRAAAQDMPNFPLDPEVRTGKLANGLTYYIRHNEEPKGLANFYIAQKVGSVQEDDTQRGLAHFLEHMCFNGSQNFPGNALIACCERMGVKFGQNLNAYTAADETVYNIDDVPTANKANIDSCLLILHDWAGYLTLDPAEIDKERGVIHEEWRLRTSATMRMLERNLEKIYPGSKYGQRMPIGLMEIIDNFKPEVLRAYYEKWYRPDLQGLVIVGDLDVDYVEAKIKEMFAGVKMPENAAKFETFPVPDNDNAIIVVDKDKEMRMNLLQLMIKQETLPREMRGGAMKMMSDYAEQVIAIAMNNRLAEASKKADCPFTEASLDFGNFLLAKTCEAMEMSILPKPGRDAEALKAAALELRRAAEYGFQETEILRARDEAVNAFEKIYDNRDKQKSKYYVGKLLRHFIEGNYASSIEVEYQTYKMLAQQLPAQMLSGLFKEAVGDLNKNIVLLAFYPEKDDVKVPTADELKAAIDAAKAEKIEGYVDNVKNDPLIAKLPKPVKIKAEADAPLGYKMWTLANGARVFYKPTDFNNSQILFSARSFGGENYLDVKDLPQADLLGTVMSATGLAGFSSTELEKKLAGKQVELAPALSATTDRLEGNSTPKDLRTLFELLYLRFQKPTADKEGYDNVIATLKAALSNVIKDPSVAFSDSVQKTVYAHHSRAPRTLPDVDKADYNRILALYGERFQSAGDFDFYFTGAINTDSLRAFTEQYIATLPGLKKREQAKDTGMRMAKGKVDNCFKRTMETPKANIMQTWNGEMTWTVKDEAVIDAFGDILYQRLLKSIREEGSMAYTVGASAGLGYTDLYDRYMLRISCPVKPDSMNAAISEMDKAIKAIAKDGVTADELAKVKEFNVKQYNDNQRKNEWWQNEVIGQTFWKRDGTTGQLEAMKAVTSDDIKDFVCRHLLKDGNCTTVMMLPEEKK